MPAYLDGFGLFVPPRVISNAELAELLGASGKDAAWIESASGIQERRWAEPETSVADLAVAAGEDCLRECGKTAADVGMVLVASGSASVGFPGPATEVATRLGISGAPAIDLPIASAGTLFGLALAMDLCERYGTVLLIGAEKMSAVIRANALDPNTAILFGDGAGAALISRDAGRWRLLDAVIHSDGEFRAALAWSGGGLKGEALKMDGLTVILQAARKMPAAIQEVLAKQNIAPAEVGTLLLHQANLNLLKRVAKALGVPEQRVFTNVQRYGNTSSASLLIAAAEWSRGEPQPGPVVFSAFGAGFQWGAVVAIS